MGSRVDGRDDRRRVREQSKGGVTQGQAGTREPWWRRMTRRERRSEARPASEDRGPRIVGEISSLSLTVTPSGFYSKPLPAATIFLSFLFY